MVNVTYCFEKLGTDEKFFADYGSIIKELVPILEVPYSMPGLRNHLPIYCEGL